LEGTGSAIPVVGLTGGMGAGKSTALEALERLGAAVLSTDAVVHALYDDPRVRDEVVERWGQDVAPDGRVDRAAVAEAAFATPDERAWLEGVLWPRVGEEVARWRAGLEDCDPRPVAAVVEVPLLFEAGMEKAFDATIAVIAEEEIRARRAEGRGHAAVDERGARQLGQDEKAARATFVVANSGTIDELEDALTAVLDKLRVWRPTG
jgi:dephospho-CoA kinase